jgi:transcriptional regulator with XRE-family HTH domain
VEEIARLGKKIKKIRISKHIPREKFAIETGIARSYIYRIEQGTSNPTVKALIEVARVLEVPVKNLIDF